MNRTVERTLAILELIANSENGITLQEIAQAMDMAKSSAFVVVHSLLELQYIKTVENNDKKYCLDIRTFSLGMKYVSDLTLIKQCGSYLPALAEKYNKTAFVGVLNGHTGGLSLQVCRPQCASGYLCHRLQQTSIRHLSGQGHTCLSAKGGAAFHHRQNQICSLHAIHHRFQG